MAEQRSHTPRVVGSIPTWPTGWKCPDCGWCSLCEEYTLEPMDNVEDEAL